MIVRPATSDDLPLATELIRQLWESHDETDWDDARLNARTAEIMKDCQCYMIGNPPIAFASLQDQGDYVLIRHFSLEKTERGKGKGRAAYEALEAHAFPGRRSRLYASIEKDGPRAFWERMGYGAFAFTMERPAGGTE